MADPYIYSTFKQERLRGDSDITAHTIRCVLVDSGGAGNPNLPAVNAADPRYTDIGANDQGGDGTTPQTQEITSKTFIGGVFDGPATTTFTSISGAGPTTATTADAIVVYDDTDAAKRLMCVVNIGSTVNFTGGNVVVDWDDATSMNGQTGGIFAL